jgi:hypothetical protein
MLDLFETEIKPDINCTEFFITSLTSFQLNKSTFCFPVELTNLCRRKG